MRSMYFHLRAWAAAAFVGLVPLGGAIANPDDIAWEQARAEGTVEAYQRYLDAFPVGRHSSDAFALIIGMTALPGQAIEPGAGVVIEPGAGPLGEGDALEADPY